MPKDSVERAVKKGAGGLDLQNIEEVRYEGYGPGGVAVIADCMTDNRKRTVSEIRHAFAKCGGNLGTDGSVAYLFSKVGQISFPGDVDEDRLMEVAIESGADDVVTNDDGSFDVLTSIESFGEVKDAIVKADLKPQEAEVTLLPATTNVLGVDEARRMVKLLDMLEDLDDVQQVYSNADISEEIMAKLGD